MDEESGDHEAAVFELLADEYARAILVATSRKPMSANELAEECDMSLPTVYRRVDDLKQYDFVRERMHVDPDGGSHHGVYEANLEHLDVDVEDGEVAVTATYREDVADRFTRLWEGVRGR